MMSMMYVLILAATTGLLGLGLALLVVKGEPSRSEEQEKRRHDGVRRISAVASDGANAVARIPAGRVSASGVATLAGK